MKISEQLIRESFTDGELARELPVFVYEEAGSTNDLAKEYAASCGDTPTRAIFIAEKQTAGRGRRGRSFLSPGGGLYLSLLLPTELPVTDAVAVTAYTAVIVKRAISELCRADVGVKWVNDIILSGKKLCGILAEGILREGTDRMRAVVVGIGLNVSGVTLPDEIRDIATTLEENGYSVPLEALTARIAELFFTELDTLGTPELASEYRAASTLIDREITVHRTDRSYPAYVLGITDSCELRLRLPDGTTELLSTGEVSVRIKS